MRACEVGSAKALCRRDLGAHTGEVLTPTTSKRVSHHKPAAWPPDAVPVLSRGKHRRPRSGACFMELVSYIAGEPWSDHPECTHPALATLARDVNDYTSDEGRGRLAPLIPSVIGLTSDDPIMEVRIALRAATAALPIAAEDRQRILAVGMLRCERELAAEPGASASDDLRAASRKALAAVPLAASWAREFVDAAALRRIRSKRRPYSGIIHHAVRGIAEACVPDADDRLYRLLSETIGDCAHRCGRKSEARRPAPARA